MTEEDIRKSEDSEDTELKNSQDAAASEKAEEKESQQKTAAPVVKETGAGKTKLGLGENVEVGLSYVLGWITGIVFYFVEKENSKIQFHAAQSVIVFLGLLILSVIIGIVPVIGGLVAMIISPLTLILWIFLMYKGFTGSDFRIPGIAGFIEEKLVGKADEITSSSEE